MAMTQEEREERRRARAELIRQKAATKRIADERGQDPVREMVITISWKKSRTWGMNPHASVRGVYHHGGHFYEDGFTCSGCGYDKESTVVAEIFNRFMKYELWRLEVQKVPQCRQHGDKVPYGISAGQYQGFPYVDFGGGVGMSCYYRIAEFMGGELRHVSWDNHVDVYIYQDKKRWFNGNALPEEWPEVCTC